MPGEHQIPAPMSAAAGAEAGPTAKKSGCARTYSEATPEPARPHRPGAKPMVRLRPTRRVGLRRTGNPGARGALPVS